MALSRFLRGSGSRSEKPPVEPPEAPKGASGLAAILRQGVQLQPGRVEMLKEGLEKGRTFFDDFNNSRLRLAFTSFDEEMKKALYEVLFLIHVNDPKFSELHYTAVELERKGGVVRTSPRDTVADLYVEGAPCGVEGIAQMSEIFRESFVQHIRETFGMEVSPASTFGYCPVKSIHSLGSIGTVGHKSRASDLDLQVQYELEPFYFDSSTWTDQTFRDALTAEARYWMNRLRAQQKLPPSALQQPDLKARLHQQAMAQLAKGYPQLFRYLVQKQGDYARELMGEKGAAQRTHVLHEIMTLMKRSLRLTRGEELKKEETLLQQRLKRIQDYIASKYPMAEIYLFACSNDDYRIGHHGSTLVSKEASGSAYELILNYETLMPGIQITPMMPTHFVFPQQINDDPALYDRMIDYLRFGMIDLYDADRERLVNLGATPDLGLEYVAKHSGAVYWEAFKASSGNLPKAILNLFRIEMLLDPRFLKTIIQTIKDPQFMHGYAAPRPEDAGAELEKMDATGVPPWALIDLEEQFPLLRQDPWWLRYKALKIAYHEEDGVKDIAGEERSRISNVIDLAFALHVRISDVFTKPGDTRPFDTHREQVLLEYLRRAFPPISPRRRFLEHLFIGEVHSVYAFERELRDLFKACLARVNRKIAALNIPGETNQKEFEIWYHYYQENFEPAKNVIQKTILKHLTVPRSRIQMGHVIGKGWFFKSIQKQSTVGKRFDTFGYLNHLPEEVMLRDNSTFLAGLAESIVNGYYGVMNQGTLKETATAIEFDSKAMDLGNRIDNTMAFLRPDNVHRVLAKIIEFFPYRPYHYMDCIQQKREIVDLLLFLNASKFGRLSLLYRDNLQTWYLDEIDHADLFANAPNFNQSPRAMFTARPLHVTLAKFYKARGVNLATVRQDAWVNPNSIATSHSLRQSAQKEQELARGLLMIIRQVHGPKEPPPEDGAEPPAEGAGPPG